MGITEEISMLYEQIASEKAAIDLLYKRKDEIIEERQSLIDDIRSVKSRISDICLSIKSVNYDLSFLYRQKEDYAYSLRLKRDEINSAYSNHADYSTIYWLKSDRDTIVDHICHIKSEIDDLKSRKDDLIDELIQAKGERSEIQYELDQTIFELEEIASSIKRHKEKKRELCERLTKLKKQKNNQE